jgi:hypothetical protein
MLWERGLLMMGGLFTLFPLFSLKLAGLVNVAAAYLFARKRKKSRGLKPLQYK